MRMNQQGKTIEHKGHINSIKALFNARMLPVNACGFVPLYSEKIEMIIEKCQEIEINILLLSETSTK